MPIKKLEVGKVAVSSNTHFDSVISLLGVRWFASRHRQSYRAQSVLLYIKIMQWTLLNFSQVELAHRSISLVSFSTWLQMHNCWNASLTSAKPDRYHKSLILNCIPPNWHIQDCLALTPSKTWQIFEWEHMYSCADWNQSDFHCAGYPPAVCGWSVWDNLQHHKQRDGTASSNQVYVRLSGRPGFDSRSQW